LTNLGNFLPESGIFIELDWNVPKISNFGWKYFGKF
jgi:hypothetical protein